VHIVAEVAETLNDDPTVTLATFVPEQLLLLPVTV
jgi:hypothetical protein